MANQCGAKVVVSTYEVELPYGPFDAGSLDRPGTRVRFRFGTSV